MAIRPVYYVSDKSPFYSVSDTEFVWIKGMSVSQQQKNVAALHDSFLKRFPDKKVLEVSSKSKEPCGISASAFFLQKFVPSLQKSVSVECVYQSSKVFSGGGPFTDILEKTSRQAKSDERLKNSGNLIKFRFENQDFPLTPKTVFYDFIYVNALIENPDLATMLTQYDAFTDIAFNPQKSINCQARAAAIFVSLSRLGLLEKAKNFESFAEFFSIKCISAQPIKPKTYEILQPSYITGKITAPVSEEQTPSISLKKDMIIEHRFFKTGKILSVSSDNRVQILFDTVGEKTLFYDWIVKNCKISD